MTQLSLIDSAHRRARKVGSSVSPPDYPGGPTAWYWERDRPMMREHLHLTGGWTPEQIALLGTKRDPDLARELGVTAKAVFGRRKARGIPAFKCAHISKDGYRYVHVERDDPMACMARSGSRQIREHRLVMARHLGRPLTDDEKPHHINGDRSDNRIENLELWSTSHPPGQRVQDKLDWAIEFIERYAKQAHLLGGRSE